MGLAQNGVRKHWKHSCKRRIRKKGETISAISMMGKCNASGLETEQNYERRHWFPRLQWIIKYAQYSLAGLYRDRGWNKMSLCRPGTGEDV